jgi:hypothetical protein
MVLGRSIENLPYAERIEYYRAMAALELQLSQRAEEDSQKAHYLDSAARWLALATEVESCSERLNDVL